MELLLILMVLLPRVGLAMYVGGLSRAKNAAGSMGRVVVDLAVAVLCAFVLGGIVQGLTGELDLGLLFGHLNHNPIGGHLLWLMAVAPLATGIVIGPVAERSRFGVIVICSVVLAAIVVPVLRLWEYGWLGRLLFVDLAGGASLHVAGGVVALVAARLVGPRQNKYHRDGSASVIPGHSLPMAGIGALLMLGGLAAISVLDLQGSMASGVANTLLAAAAGTLASLVFSHLRYGKPDVLLLLTGMLGGAVSLAANPAMLPIWAIVTGAVAGILVPFVAVALDLRLHVDDPTSAVAIHLVGGAWGVLAAGIFSGNGVAETFKSIGVQCIGLAVVIAVAGAAGLIALKLLGGSIRAKEADEFDGLDLAEHDVGAYPDFQQNTIRSYHLREA